MREPELILLCGARVAFSSAPADALRAVVWGSVIDCPDPGEPEVNMAFAQQCAAMLLKERGQ